ncbi:hypothetical protein [Streptomyces mirabilis]|jgi:hypothetical protein|uniref:Uncharacterized protein n=1 Tax=Streptomyces mirabilis TaxID=68239 RepID=A0A1I2WQN6_9ACTN|nr:hypothetical protein [Streptomyces mirabilis]SFH01911.1 hypothetical protein SAMN02787118_13831 [Streptomyces mirabilis]
MVLALTARDSTSDEIVAHLTEVYGLTTSKDTPPTITRTKTSGTPHRR